MVAVACSPTWTTEGEGFSPPSLSPSLPLSLSPSLPPSTICPSTFLLESLVKAKDLKGYPPKGVQTPSLPLL